jgi:hypothetical protein
VYVLINNAMAFTFTTTEAIGELTMGPSEARRTK